MLNDSEFRQLIVNMRSKVDKLDREGEYPPNRALFHEGAERPYDVIAGIFLMMKEDLWLEDYVNLSDSEVDEYKQVFEDPVCLGGYRP